MKILKYQSFLNENTSIDSNSMKIIADYYNEILKSNAPLSKISFMGYFTALSAFRSSLYENLYETYKKVLEGNRKDILEKNLKNILLIELRLDKMAKNAGEGNTGSKDKLSTKRSTLDNSWSEDKYSKSKKIYESEIENNLSNLEKIIEKMNSEFDIKPVSIKSTDTKDPQVRYKELLSEWKEGQKKLGKNTSPGQGTRSRLMKQAKSELGIKENIIFRFESFDYEEPEGQGDPEEAQGEPDFRKIMVPGTNLNLDEFEKKFGTPITYYELSKDGKEVTEINGRPIADVIAEEFPEEDIEQWVYLNRGGEEF